MDALIDPDRRRELGAWVIQGAGLFGAGVVLLAIGSEAGGWSGLVLLTAIALGGWRIWTADRLPPSSAQVYARIMIGEYLPSLIEIVRRDRQLLDAWRSFAPAVDHVVDLPWDEANKVSSRLQHIPLKSLHRRTPALTLAWTIASFVLGLVLPGLLANLAGVQEVVSGARHAQFGDFLQPRTLFVLGAGIYGTILWRRYVSRRNADQWARIRGFMDGNLPGEMWGMANPIWIGRRAALQHELNLAHWLSRLPDGNLISTEDPYGIGRTQPGWRQWRLADADEASINNFLLALSVLISLVLAGA